MRASTFSGMLIFAAACVLAATPNLTQGQFKKGGGFGGGGFGGGAPRGLNANMVASINQDPGAYFDTYLSRGRGYFIITEARSLSDLLSQYCQEKGISNGQMNRQQFVDFQARYKDKMDAASGGGGMAAAPSPAPFSTGGGMPFGPGGGMPFGGKGKKGFGGPDMGGGFGAGGMGGGGGAPNLDAINAQADALFDRMDKNGDGKLNQDEMPAQLRAALDRFDKNRDGLIDKAEFRDYFLARISGDTDPTAGRGGNQIIIDEDELDRKPVVLRAGKLPANMPDWFAQYDLDNDGQVALWEWRKANKKSLDEFAEWDLNDDGLITPEEALKHQIALAKDSPEPKRGFRGPPTADADAKAAFVEAFKKRMQKGQDRDPGANGWGDMKKGNKKKGGGKGQQQQDQ